MKLVGHEGRRPMEEMRNEYNILVHKGEGKGSPGRDTCKRDYITVR
jgi:hypothetical protein